MDKSGAGRYRFECRDCRDAGNGGSKEIGIGKTPVGRRGNIIGNVAKNTPITINNVKFTGHALDRMQARGILSPRAVLDVVENPTRILLGNEPGTTVYLKDNLKVVTNIEGNIITVVWQ